MSEEAEAADLVPCQECGVMFDVSDLPLHCEVDCPQCGHHQWVKSQLGHYTLTRKYAIGGMSVVFLARDETLARDVIVKVLNEEYSRDEKRIQAFEREANLTASISHPNVVKVFTTGRAYGQFYIAMEWVSGGHYEDQIRTRGAIPETEVLPMAIQVADGLRAAHHAGLIHRDVKPGNILLDAAGNAKIVDFGLALVTKGGLAQADELWATPWYVPPETFEGRPEDFRSDIYAFGATLYHALAGKPPCEVETMDSDVLRVAKQNITPLKAAAPQVGLATAAVVDRCMAYRPADRFSSYDELIAALEAAKRQPNARDAALAERRKKSVAQSSTRISIGAVIILALSFAAWKMAHRPPESVQTDQKMPPPAVEKTSVDERRLADLYRIASEARNDGSYLLARERFAAVRDEPGALEPTASWAACEAVISCQLAGQPGLARTEAVKSLAHITAADLPEPVKLPLMDALSDLPKLPPIVRKSQDVPTGPDLLVALLAGLKNWESGQWKQAVPHFQALVKAPLAPQDLWARPYQALAQKYLDDEAKIRAASLGDLPKDADGVLKEMQQVDHLLQGLQTQGRAVFNLKDRQRELRELSAKYDAGH
jgi:eukaryotic-like serine/threonine-protein kinase